MAKITIKLSAEELKKKLDLKNGEKGDRGAPGPAGHTPIAGVDFEIPKSPETQAVAETAATIVFDKLRPLIPQQLYIEKELFLMGKVIRDTLENLEEDERLDRSAIKGLDDYEEISRLAREPKTIYKVVGGGAGSRLFTQLLDVPNSYTGQALKAVRVNAAATGLEFYVAGGGGTPGGSSGDIQYNNSGAFAGVPGFTFTTPGGNNLLTIGTEINASAVLANYIVAGLYTTQQYGNWAFEVLVDGLNPPFNGFRVRDVSGAGSDNFTIDRQGNVNSLGNINAASIVGFGGVGAVQFADNTTSYITGTGNLKADTNGLLWNGTNSSTLSVINSNVFDATNHLSLDWNLKQLYDVNLSTLSLDWGTRILYASDGITGIIDFSNSSSGANYYFSSGLLQGNGSALTNIAFLDASAVGGGGFAYTASPNRWGPNQFDTQISSYSNTAYFDDSGFYGDGSHLTGITATNANYLYDTAGTPLIAADGVNRKLYAANGTTMNIDWTGTQNYSANISFANGRNTMIFIPTIEDGLGFNSIDTLNRFRYDGVGNTVDNWGTRILYASNGTTALLDWSNSATAAAYYFSGSILQGDGSGLTGILATAPNTSYTPSTSANWSGDPTTIKEAIDRIAAVVSASGAIPIP